MLSAMTPGYLSMVVALRNLDARRAPGQARRRCFEGHVF